MHPTLCRFLDVDVLRRTLARAEHGEPLDPDERALVRVAQRAPEHRRQIGKLSASRASSETQRATLFLALHAAAEAVREDERLKDPVEEARAVLSSAGATGEEVDGTLAAFLSEEAFGYADDGEDFDAEFFRETLATLPALLDMTSERVTALRAELLLGRSGSERGPAERAFEALLTSAWAEGPEPINPEHLAEAEDRLEDGAEKQALKDVLRLLERKGLLGPRRRERLEKRGLRV
jgi:hypothetical protein